MKFALRTALLLLPDRVELARRLGEILPSADLNVLRGIEGASLEIC
jgi:hypothetical protein